MYYEIRNEKACIDYAQLILRGEIKLNNDEAKSLIKKLEDENFVLQMKDMWNNTDHILDNFSREVIKMLKKQVAV